MHTLSTTIELATRDRRHFVHAKLIGLTVLALLLQLIGMQGWIRELLVLAVFTFVPGAAVLSLMPRVNPLMWLGLSASFSLLIVLVPAYLLVLISAFKPGLLIWTIFPASAGVLFWRDFTTSGSAWRQRNQRQSRRQSQRARARKRNQEKTAEPIETSAAIELTRRRVGEQLRASWTVARSTRANRWALGALAAGLLLWFVGVQGVDFTKMGDYGLISVLPAPWPLGFATVLIATSLYAVSGKPNPWIMASLVGGVVVIIYATAPLVYEAPHLPWVYKHVGVVNLLLDQGHAIRDADIYNRWPGMFALGAVFTRFSGSSPVNFIGWAELYFIGLQTSMVASLMWNETKRVAPSGLAAVLFVLINWIGQAYFSPQALAFTFMLAFFVVAFSQLYDTGNGVGRAVSGLTGFVVRRKQQWGAKRPKPELSTRTAVIACLALDVGVAIAHQLTPYVLLIQLGILTLCGFIRPRWLWAGCAVITIAYLLPNLAWVNENYGLFSSLDPFNNTKVADPNHFTCSTACQLISRISTLASAFSWLTGLIAIVVLARRRPTFRLPLYGLSMFGAFVMIFGQSYGGEAALRVVMFSSPFAAILIAAAIETFGTRLRTLLAVGLTLVLAVSFLYAYFGNEEYYYVTRDSVESAEYLYANAPKGSVLLFTAEDYPGRIAGNYNDYPLSGYTGTTGIFDDRRLLNRPLGPEQIPYLIEDIEVTSKNGFVVFSPEQDHYVTKKGIVPPGEMENLRAAMLASGRFEIWKQNGGTVIYRLIPPKE